MKSFRELVVWQKSMDLTDAVYDVVRNFPAEEKFALGDQLRRAVVSIPSNIAEGFGRETHRDFAHFLSQARGSLYEVDTQIEIAVRRGYVKDVSVVIGLLNEVSKLLAAFSRRLRAPVSPSPNAPDTKH